MNFNILNLIRNVFCAELDPSTLYTLTFFCKTRKSWILPLYTRLFASCASLHHALWVIRRTRTDTAFILIRVLGYFFFSRWICAEWVGPRHHMLVICWWNSHMGAFQHWVTITEHLHRANGYPNPASKQTRPLLFSEKTTSKSSCLCVSEWDFLACGLLSTSSSKYSLKLFLDVVNIKAL